mmetsp:Transcript_70723/g.165865  ORF Transcript_70723/g.165865 Transcript_70723/m.165865 type:complete len:432 (+) Transcript_70723:3649-4944(+)
MLHSAHAAITRPAHLVGVAHNVLVVGVRVLGQEPLNQIPRILLAEAEDHDEAVQVAAIQPDRMPQLSVHVLEGQELIGQLGWSSDLRGPGQAQHQEVQHHAVVLEHKGAELQTLDEAIGVCVVHVLVIDHNVVLRSHVVRNVVINDKAEQAIQQRQVDLLRNVFKLALQHHHALTIRGVPDVRQVVDTLAPLVDQQGGRLRVCRLHPVGEEMPMVTLIPKVLVQVCIGDLLQRLNLIARHQVGVHVLELDGDLLESSLGQQMTLDSGQSFVRIVVSLLHQAQFLSLLLVQARLHCVLLLQSLQSQNQQLCVVLVIQRRERNRGELSRLQPVHCGRVDGHSLLTTDIRTILQVVVLPLLLCLQPKTGESAQVFLACGLVHRGTSANTLSIVVRRVGPPVGLGLDVAQDHVLNRGWQARHLPRDVRLPAAPCL